nr:retrovirus-related Pol polyprotein from transposon TNT 1-94 [Tanacetum cinerariifolium]
MQQCKVFNSCKHLSSVDIISGNTYTNRRANNRVVLALTSFFLFCMSSVVIAIVLSFFFVEEETSPASPLSLAREERESYKKDPKVEEPAPKAMIAIDGIGWDWSYMAKENEASNNHALVVDKEEVPTEYALMAKSSSSLDNENELEEVKKEKESIDFKIENFENALKDIDKLLGSQKQDKDMKGVGFNKYCVVPPPPAQVYSPPKNDLSWMGLPEFVDDTITNYTRPTPSIDVSKSVSKVQKERWKSNNPSFFEQGGSSGNVVSKPMIKFVKVSGCPNATKVNNTKNARKPTVKYAEIHGRGKITGKGSIKTGKDFKLVDDKHVLLRTPRQQNMYTIDMKNVVPHKNLTCLIAKALVEESMLWHRRLGHLNFKTMNKLVRSNLVKGLPSKSFENDHSYVSCLKEKHHKASCKSKLVTSVSNPLHTLHIDLFGPISVTSLNHKGYCLVVTDDFSRVLVIKPYNKTPYELFNERSHAIGFLRPFGCYVMILNTLDHLGKFDAKGDEGYFIGYSLSSKAFRVFNKRTKRIDENLHVDFLENKSIEKGTGTKEDVHQAVKEKESPLRFIAILNCGNSNPTASTNVFTNDSFELASSSTVETEVPTVSTHVLTDSLYDPLVTSSVPRIISIGGSSFLEPLSLGNAMSFENSLEDFFRDTSNAVSLNEVEVDLSNMETIIQALVDYPSRVRPIGTKWVLKNKKDESGIVIRNKARLVAQGHTQEEGIDYEEVFTPVARIEAIRLFLAYASYMGFTVYQMDVKSAFWYGTIVEEVHVMQPPGFQDPEFPHRVYKVEKAMYGLHQAPRAWYGTLSKYLLDNGFQRDIMFDVCTCARYQVTPKECHLHAVKRIFRYLKGNPKLGLWYHKESPFELVAYSDGNYGGANTDRKSTTIGCQFLGRRLISWQCKKQTIVATFTTKAEYVASASGCGQVLWIQNQLLDYGVETTDRETAILAKVNGRQRTVSESSIRRHLKLNDEEDETAFPTGDVKYEEAFPTDTSLDASQDRENIAKTSTIPHEELPRVASLGGGEGKERVQSQDLEITQLKAKVKTLEDNERRREGFAQEDSLNTMGWIKGRATNILDSKGLRSVFTTASLSIATASTSVSSTVATASESFPTAAIFTIASVATPTTRDKGKGKMTKPEQPSKEKVLEQMSVQLARDLEAKFAQEDQIITEQAERDSEIARIHVKKELKMMIAELDRSNEMVAKYLSEYEQAEAGLSHDEKVELIDELLMYQRNLAQIKKYQAQQNKLATKTERRNFYMSIMRSNEQQSKEPKELSKEEFKKMMELVLVEELYIEALQVKYPIIDWEIYSEGQRKCWKIIRVGNHTKVCQIFEDMLKKFDREDLDKL